MKDFKFNADDFVSYTTPHPHHVSYSSMAEVANKALQEYLGKDDLILDALRVINTAQHRLWELSVTFMPDDPKGAIIWAQSLQIEHALLELNAALYGKREYL